MKKILLTLLTVVCAVGAWGYTYTKVTSAPQDWSGEYVVVVDDDGTMKYWTGVDAGQCRSIATMSGEKISDCPITITVAALAEGGYSIKVNGGENDGKYISSGTSAPTYSNGLKFNATAHRVDFAMDANGCVQMSQSIAQSGTMYFLYNANSGANNERFRFYKNTNLGNSNYPTPYLYKKDAAAGIAVTGVTLDKTSANVNVGETTPLTATVAPANADNKSVTWSTSNADVATVSNTGVVTGVAAGNATITVKTVDGNFSATCNVTVTAIAVTGISLDKTEASVTEGETETLVATIAPANAANKNVTWASSNEAVATVSDGVVTAVAPGTATITATSEDGNFEASCDVTVIASPYALAYTFDFTVNNFKLPTSALKNKEGEYTYDGKTIKLYGDASNGFKFSTNYLIMGKEGAYLTLPAFDFPVGKIVVVGRSAASGSVVQNIYVGNTAVSTATTGATGINSYEINSAYKAAGNIYTLKVTSAHNTQITAVKIYRQLYADVTVTAAGYTTYYNSAKAFRLPTGMTASVWSDGLVEMYEEGKVVPADEPVVLKADEGNYKLEFTTSEEETYKENKMNDLDGTDTETTLEDDANSYFYGLSLNSSNDINSVGFYWMAEDGAAFTNGAHKAYLKLPKTPGAKSAFRFNNTTGIKTLNNEQSVSKAVKRIMNGQLVIEKAGKMYNAAGAEMK